MSLRTSDVVPISEARARLTELAEEVVDGGAEKVLTKNGSSYVALVDAKKLDYYHFLEQEHANLVLLDEAERGLRQLLAGQRIDRRPEHGEDAGQHDKQCRQQHKETIAAGPVDDGVEHVLSLLLSLMTGFSAGARPLPPA